MDGHIGGYGGWHSEITPECSHLCFKDEPFDPRPWAEQQEQIDSIEEGAR